MTDNAPDPERPTGHVDESELEPVTRDGRFIVRLVLALAVGLMGAIVIGAWMRGAAANCGSSLVRPGANVIPNR
ncbi:MAG: hypothetical protein U0269_35815 [Polyangiales bacterium]